ncbi:MAG: hypothetical protein U9R75_09860 [Candidatus Thermoplasmatota archaeon]|nr:hypothetical protein [Candidatus Thermoplasmatota archaeon]MEA3559545.1 hypothetical protein [Candidatus Thermoplasmatota archaeon]
MGSFIANTFLITASFIIALAGTAIWAHSLDISSSPLLDQRMEELLDREDAPTILLISTTFVWLVCMAITVSSLTGRKERRPQRIGMPYGPATLPIEEERVPLVPDGEKSNRYTFQDVGVYGVMEVASEK